MSFFERFKKAAGQAIERASAEAERAARYVAEHGPGFVGEGAAELLAERDYHQAAELAAEGQDAATAARIRELLEPHGNVDSRYAVLIHRLLGEAALALGERETAMAEFEQAVTLLNELEVRRGVEPVLYDEIGRDADELARDLVLEQASLDLAAGRYDACLRRCVQVRGADPKAWTAYYLEGAALLARGAGEELVIDLFQRAVNLGAGASVAAWVSELLPARAALFAGLDEG